MAKIETVTARRVWDSRGHPTVEVDVRLTSGALGRAIAPAGASRGTREAMDLRDGGAHLNGKDVSKALANVNGQIAHALKGCESADQAQIDAVLLALDASPLKNNLGGNAMVATSLAVLHAAAAEARLPLWEHVANLYGTTPSLPLPEIQIFGGGAHAERRVDVQDFMIMVPGAHSFDEVMEITSEVYFAAGDTMARRGQRAGVADEGGWWPLFKSNEEALETLVAAIELAGETPGERVVISLDIAASEFAKDGRYNLALEERELDSVALLEMLSAWVEAYPIVSIEDPVSEEDDAGMLEFTRRFNGQLQIIGDDYLVTNAALVTAAAQRGACNSALIKVNQAGTVTEAVEAHRAAQDAGWTSVLSARSGETEDTSISHLSVGLGAGQLKVGSFQRSERMVKWNECLRIQDQLGADAFVGGSPLRNTWWGKKHLG
ncbi:MAG: phosphopyruvate hydratase [Pseudomonadota bacterium]